MKYFKKLYFVSLFFLFFFSYFILNNNLEFSDSSTISEMLINTYDEIDLKIKNEYKVTSNIETLHRYGALGVYNIDQEYLKNWYNNLGDERFDLNYDSKLDENDNLGNEGGICQPTAVTMVLTYLARRGDLIYDETFFSDLGDCRNVFYCVVEAYSYLNWCGSGASTSDCYKAFNQFFINHNNPYLSKYTTSNMIDHINTSYENKIPSVAHISGSNGGHAVSVCGYYIKKFQYQKQVLWWTEQKEETLYYLIVNDGWKNVIIKNNITNNYTENYSFINLNDIKGITYIEKK